MNWNVSITLLQRVADAFAQGIWTFVALPTYIWLVENHSNTAIGYAQGIQGFATAAVAIPAGLMADKTRRDKVLRAFGVVGLGAVAATVGAVLIPKQPLTWQHLHTDTKFAAICGASALWGIYSGAQPVVESIFADSVATGSRTGLYSVFTALQRVAICFGPLGAALIFWWSGNAWKIPVIEQILLWGVGISAVSIIPMFLFNDDKTLGIDSEAYQEQLAIVQDDDEPCSPRWRALKGRITTNSIPYLLATSDIITGLASGMTLKFMPIFLLQACDLDPITVNIYTFIAPLMVAGIMFALPPIAKLTGRVQILLLLKCSGVVLLFWMGLVPSIWKQPYLIMGVSLVRLALMNAGYPVQKSILMDYVPRSTRARWNSIESIMTFGWSGSAVLGGFLIDRTGFRVTFLITAGMQTLSLIFLVALLPVVPVKERSALSKGHQHCRPDTGQDTAAAQPASVTEALLVHEARDGQGIEPC